MSSKHHKNYGSVLYARILIYLRESKTPQTVVNVADAVLCEGYSSSDKQRVVNVLNNLAKTGEIHRDTEPSAAKHVRRYIFTYNDNNLYEI